MTGDDPSTEKTDSGPQGETPTATQNKTKQLVRVAKWLIAVLVAVGLAWAGKSAVNQWQVENQKRLNQVAEIQIAIEFESDPQARFDLEQQCERLQASVASIGNLRWSRIFLAALLYAAGIFVPGFVLRAALQSLGERPRAKTAIASQLLGHAGKYVPGKAMVIVLRAGGLAIDGVRPVRATISVFMETLLMMAVGAAVACVVIVWLPVPQWMTWSAIGVALLASVPTLPPILKRVAAKVSGIDESSMSGSGQDETGAGDGKTLDQQAVTSSARFFVTGWAWSLVSWLLIGASFTALVSAIPSVMEDGAASTSSLPSLYAVSLAAIAFAMVVGFASLLPGGAGVRELVLTTILSTAVGPAHALLAALAARLMFICVEGVCAGGAWLWLQKQETETKT